MIDLDFSDITVNLVGDFMIDHYIMGTSNRISPEAPVPVVIPEEEYSIPGGAGNVAMNLRAMGANVNCIGVVGNDVWGEKLISILNSGGADISGISVVKNHPTTLKQRIYSNGKQVARLDREKIVDWTPNWSSINLNTCIISDYNKGVINSIPNINSLTIVDPKKEDFSLYQNVNIITPNLNELQRATDISIKDDESIIYACNELIKKNNFDYIVAKKGSKGITVVGKNNFFVHINTSPVKNADVTGAGDTVISALSLAYTQTQDIEFSAKLANEAGKIAVSKSGTASATIREILGSNIF
jgi:rfaE bifunctional protein kinase chain/domain